MASWKGLYSNVAMLGQGTKDLKAPKQRRQPDSEEIPEVEENTYEPVDPAIRLEGKQAGSGAAVPLSPAWKPRVCPGRNGVAGGVVLLMSISLNVLLLALGIVHYSKMVATLQQAHTENQQLQEAVPDPFLMYNEALNVCMTLQQPNNLIKASCDPGVLAQHFQRLSGGLLRHVASQLCVEASVAKNRVAILLKPCNPQRSLQRWECRDHNLLALQGTNLYFNYGNSAKQLAMLYSQSGHWSRWLIYGTHSNICSTCNPFSTDWTFFQGSYYFFSHMKGSWDVANQSCASMGFHLVMINNIEEKGHIAAIMKAPSCWIGLTDQVLDGDWKWVDGMQLGHGNSYWHPNEPNGGEGENCAVMQNSLWFDYPCRENFHWICERKL